jgi:hypothetical protein
MTIIISFTVERYGKWSIGQHLKEVILFVDQSTNVDYGNAVEFDEDNRQLWYKLKKFARHVSLYLIN